MGKGQTKNPSCGSWVSDFALFWYAQQDSNLRPLAPQTNALSRLSYGHTVEKSHVILIYKKQITQGFIIFVNSWAWETHLPKPEF